MTDTKHSAPCHLIPDAACKQGKCALTTTRCQGKCFLENPPYIVSNSPAAAPTCLPSVLLNPDGHACRCPHCGKLNMDLDIAGDPAGQDFMCIRCGEGFKIAASPAAAPKAALTDEQIMRIAGDMKQRNAGVWPGDVAFARAIEAASGPNAALVEALKQMLSDFEGCYADGEPAIIAAPAALAAAGVKP